MQGYTPAWLITANGQDHSGFRWGTSKAGWWLGTRRSSHNQVTARWTDAAGTGHDVVVGGGASEETSNTMLAEDFDNGDDALGAATAKLNALSISQDSVSLSMVGNPKVACEVRLILSAFKAGVDGTWVVARVQHHIDDNGYVSDVEAVSQLG